MEKYFINVTTLEDLRKQYKSLLKTYHPDNSGGSEEICKAINIEYENIFAALKNGTINANAEKKTSYDFMKWDMTEDAALREKLSHVIHLSDINITIVGHWIWIDGNTYQHRQELKVQGFKWAKEKKRWYWHSEAFRKRSKKKLSFDAICNLYGSIDIQTEKPLKLA